MATTADATLALPSPRGGASAMDSSRRMQSPWTKIVRGPDIDIPTSPSVVSAPFSPPPLSPPGGGVEEVVTCGIEEVLTASGASTTFSKDAPPDAQAESCDHPSNGANGAKKAWNKPGNGGGNVANESGPVMGTVWPALSESTRASPKSSSSDLSKTLSDGSFPVQVTGATSPSANANKQGVSATANSTPNHPHNHNRPRSAKRPGGNPNHNSSSNGAISQMPSPRGTAGETNPGNSGRHSNPSADSSSNTHRDGGQRSQLHTGNEHQHQRNSYRRGSGGPHPRGDGPHHHGYGGRRGDQDRGNQDWNSNRSFGGRDGQVQQQRVNNRPFMRGPTPNPPQPFFPPAAMPMRPIGTPVVYPEMPPVFFLQPGPPPHPDSFRALSMVPQMQPMFFPFPDPQLHAKVVNQIDYYFSNENLIKDTFLRQNMDEQGWVPIKLIASFKKVMQLTDNVQYILDSVRTSSILEVEGEKVRRRNDWARWIMPTAVQYHTVSSPQSVQRSSQDALAAGLHNIGLEDNAAKQSYAETYLSPSSSGEWSSLSQQSSGDKTGQIPLSTPNSSK